MSGDMSDVGDWHYYIWHQGNDASFPTTTDEMENEKIKNSICWRKHTHTRSLCVLFPRTKLDVMRCTHDLWKSLLPSAVVFFVTARQCLYTHLLLGAPNIVTRGKMKQHSIKVPPLDRIFKCSLSKSFLVWISSQPAVQQLKDWYQYWQQLQKKNGQYANVSKDAMFLKAHSMNDVSISLKLMSKDAPSSQIRKLRGISWVMCKAPLKRFKADT